MVYRCEIPEKYRREKARSARSVRLCPDLLGCVGSCVFTASGTLWCAGVSVWPRVLGSLVGRTGQGLSISGFLDSFLQ